MKRGLIFGLLAGCILVDPIGHNAGAQKAATQAKPDPQDEARNAELRAIREALERIAAAQDAQGDEGKAADEKQHADDDLIAQQAVAYWAMPMFWTTLFSALVGLGSVIALVLTFRAQQKLNRDQASAILETIGATVQHKREMRFGVEETQIEVTIFLNNAGQTTAFGSEVTIFATYVAALIEGKPAEGDKDFAVKMACAPFNSIGAHEQGSVAAFQHGGEWLARLLSQEARRPHIGTESCAPMMLRVHGWIKYRDVFGRTRPLDFVFEVRFLSDEPQTMIGSGGDFFSARKRERQQKAD